MLEAEQTSESGALNYIQVPHPESNSRPAGLALRLTHLY
jgi:hypothetical protein